MSTIAQKPASIEVLPCGLHRVYTKTNPNAALVFDDDFTPEELAWIARDVAERQGAKLPDNVNEWLSQPSRPL